MRPGSDRQVLPFEVTCVAAPERILSLIASVVPPDDQQSPINNPQITLPADIASSRATRSSIGGCVLNNFASPPPCERVDDKHVRGCRGRIHRNFSCACVKPLERIGERPRFPASSAPPSTSRNDSQAPLDLRLHRGTTFSLFCLDEQLNHCRGVLLLVRLFVGIGQVAENAGDDDVRTALQLENVLFGDLRADCLQ